MSAETGKHVPAMLAGSHRRGSGRVVHALPAPFDWNAIARAACGAKPGPRSAGWAPMLDLQVTCGKCLKAIGNEEAAPGGEPQRGGAGADSA